MRLPKEKLGAERLTLFGCFPNAPSDRHMPGPLASASSFSFRNRRPVIVYAGDVMWVDSGCLPDAGTAVSCSPGPGTESRGDATGLPCME